MNKPAVLNSYTLSDPQLAAALARDGDVAVTAGAGTGKTRTLVARYLALLAEDVPLRRIVAITFTRKAAREMRNRVRQEIGRMLSGSELLASERAAWKVHYNGLDAARIGTIHNLCAEILRTHPAEIGIDPGFGVLDETRSALLLQEAADAALAWAAAMEEPAALFSLLAEAKLRDLILTMLRQRLAADEFIKGVPAEDLLHHWQSQLADYQAAVIERLLANPSFLAARDCLVRNKASSSDDRAELQRRLALAALSGLENESLAGRLRYLAALNEISLGVGSQKYWPGGKAQLDEVKQAFKVLRDAYRAEPALSLQLNDQDEAIAGSMPALYSLYTYAAATYKQLKASLESLDFDDLEAGAIHVLQQYPAARAYWQDQVRALLVDEFQDTNQRQCQFIRLLCPHSGKLFVVGDAKQSIYRFRGADVSVFAAEKARIHGQGGALIELDVSYRAHESLLEGMNELLAPVLGQEARDSAPWMAPFAALRPAVEAASYGLESPFIEFHVTFGTKSEALPRAAMNLAVRLQGLNEQNNLDYGEMAVLCRASSAFHYYEDAFDDARIPYLTVAGKGFLDRPEIRDLLNALRAVADPHDDVALAGLLRSPACGLSDVSLYRLLQMRSAGITLWDALRQAPALPEAQQASRLSFAIDLVSELNQQAGRMRAADLLNQFLDTTYYRAILRRAGQTRALRNVAKLLDDVHRSDLVNVMDFLTYAQTLRESGAREGEARATAGGAVQIMTIHAAKGLEFPVVVLGDANSGRYHAQNMVVDEALGVLLSTKNDDDVRAASYQLWQMLDKAQSQAETDRMLYVALTRAEQLVLVNGHASLKKSGQASFNGWLGQLAEVTGLAKVDLSGYDESGGRAHSFDLSLKRTNVQAMIYEPHCIPRAGPPTDQSQEEPAFDLANMKLRQALQTTGSGSVTGPELQPQVWGTRSKKNRRRAPGHVIGTLVHEALATWRFPQAGFEAWVASRARHLGVCDQQCLSDAQRRTRHLLERFREHPFCLEIENADKRLHELPYIYDRDGVLENGKIDLLFRRGKHWTLVDFKTDYLRDEAAYQRTLAEQQYSEQLGRYRQAVESLLHVEPRLILCLLDFMGDVRLVVNPDQSTQPQAPAD